MFEYLFVCLVGLNRNIWISVVKNTKKIEKLDLQSRVAMRERWATSCCCCCWSFRLDFRFHFRSPHATACGCFQYWVTIVDPIWSAHGIFNGFCRMDLERWMRRHHRLRFLCRFYCCHVLCVDLSMDDVCIRFFWNDFFSSELMLRRLVTNDRAPNISVYTQHIAYVCVLCRHSLEDWPKF